MDHNLGIIEKQTSVVDHPFVHYYYLPSKFYENYTLNLSPLWLDTVILPEVEDRIFLSFPTRAYLMNSYFLQHCQTVLLQRGYSDGAMPEHTKLDLKDDHAFYLFEQISMFFFLYVMCNSV